MANPQAENGHLRIATEIVKQLARLNLSAYEWRVIWAVWSKTWAWQKKSDLVPVSQISKITGLRPPHISRAKASLLKRHILFEDGDKIGFQKDYELWEVKGFTVTDSGNKTVTDSGNRTAQSVTDSGRSVTDLGNDLLPNQGNSKEKKETIQKKDDKSFDRFWAVYPRKVGKGAARKLWAKIKPNQSLFKRILAAIDNQKESEQWLKEDGRFIPHPTTWLNQERWEDEVKPMYNDPTDEEADAAFARLNRRNNVGNN